jgi:hypothetical protein
MNEFLYSLFTHLAKEVYTYKDSFPLSADELRFMRDLVGKFQNADTTIWQMLIDSWIEYMEEENVGC